jgi:hypothetical protein
MDQRVREAVAFKDFAAAARNQGTWLLWRQPRASFPHRIFSRGPIPLFPPGLKIRFRPAWQKNSPCILEFDAGLVEGGRGTAGTLPG